MLKRLLNECVLKLELRVDGRLLSKDAEPKAGDNGQEAHAVTTCLADGTDSVYLPGASLKGVLRSQAERIARTLNKNEAGSCDPFAIFSNNKEIDPPHDVSCSERLQLINKDRQRRAKTDATVTMLPIPQRYKDVCPICRLFGHTHWGRRLRVTDFYPAVQPTKITMTHIGIDRVGGGVSQEYKGRENYGSGRTFAVEYLYQASFEGQLILENFELWQIGLLGFLYQDMVDGMVHIGYRQTTGIGRIVPTIKELQFTQIGLQPPPNDQLFGIGALYKEGEPYGYQAEKDKITKIDGLAWQTEGVIRQQASLNQAQSQALFHSLASKTAAVLRKHEWESEMEIKHLTPIWRHS